MANVEGLDAGFRGALNAMIAASGGRLGITSAFRSVEEQKRLWDKSGHNRKMVAPPGKSNHNKGLAADLSFKGKGAKEWAHANAAKFGLHFPMSWENWHVEPINARGAKKGHTAPPGDPAAEVPEEEAQRKPEEVMDAFASILSGAGTTQAQQSVSSAAPMTRSAAPTRAARTSAPAAAPASGDLTPDEAFILQRESGLNVNAKNKKSSAFGIGQLILSNRKNYGKKFGFDPNTTDYNQQLQMFRAYVADRYKSPAKAKEFWMKNKHY